MPARKAAKKGTKKAASKAGGAKKASAKLQKLTANQIIAAVLKRREWVMYGIPIQDLTATGKIAELRQVSQAARTHLEDVQNSIGKLDAAIRAKSQK